MGKETVLDYGRVDVNGCDHGRGAAPTANANVSCRLIALVSMTLGCWRSTVDWESGSVHVGAHGHGYGSLRKLAVHKKKPYPGLSAKDRAWKPVYCSPLPSYVLFVAGLSYCYCAPPVLLGAWQAVAFVEGCDCVKESWT
jgi:hypothetical protein